MSQHPPHPEQPHGAHVPPQTKSRRSRLRWLPWALAAVMTVIAFVSCAVNSTLPAAPTPSQGGPITVPYTPPTVAPAAVAPTPDPQSGPRTSFGDGTWEIGVDIAPGKYKSAGPTESYEGAICFAQTTKKGDGEIGDIVNQKVVKGPITYVIPATGVKFFESNGCQTWTKTG